MSGKDNYKEAVRQAFFDRRTIIFIGAAGIAVRTIAPFLKSKHSDPAVLVLDEQANYVISLLSGHIGGANALAKKVADLTGAQAVITTATDRNGLFAVDVCAAVNGLTLSDPQRAKEFSSALLRKRQAFLEIPKGLRSCYVLKRLPPELTVIEKEGTGDLLLSPFVPGRQLQLIPRQLILGFGCRAGKEYEKLLGFLRKILWEQHLDERSLCAMASIDLKKEEPGLLRLAAQFQIPFYTFSPDQLAAQEGEFADSEFVEKVTGVSNVCERAAIAAGATELLVRKKAEDGMTIAIGILPAEIDFGRE